DCYYASCKPNHRGDWACPAKPEQHLCRPTGRRKTFEMV
ncbi:hypothetical protein, partial [Methylomonas fluvii]